MNSRSFGGIVLAVFVVVCVCRYNNAYTDHDTICAYRVVNATIIDMSHSRLIHQYAHCYVRPLYWKRGRERLRMIGHWRKRQMIRR